MIAEEENKARSNVGTPGKNINNANSIDSNTKIEILYYYGANKCDLDKF